MKFTGPHASADMIKNDIEAGEYIGIGLDLGRISEGQMTAIKAKLENTKAKLEAEDFTGLTKDDILGDLLHTTAVSYFAELDVMDHVQGKTMDVNAIRLPSETLFSYEMKVNKFMDVPLSVEAGGLAMDADRIMTLTRALDADKEKQKQFMLASGMNSSALEHSVPEQLFSTADNPAEGISAVKALKIANDQGIPIYTIDQSNINTILPQLQVDGGTITDIQNAVNAGKVVTVSKTDITYEGWTGCGYIIIDPDTGEGGYMISGGMSGAVILLEFLLYVLSSLFVTNAYADEPYKEQYNTIPDMQCIYQGAFKCVQQAIVDAIWNQYMGIGELLCLVIIKVPHICAALGAVIFAIGIVSNTDKLKSCLEDVEAQCPDIEP